MSLYRASSGPTKSGRKLDGAETHRGYELKNATQTHAHTNTHTTVFIHPPYPHHFLLVSLQYKMYTGIHILTAVLKEGWMWRVWGEDWHWEAEWRWSRKKRSRMRRSTSRRQRFDWWWRQRQL